MSDVTNIIIAGGSGQLIQTITRACEKNGGVRSISGGCVCETGEEPAFCIMTADCIGDLSGRGIVVFGGKPCRAGRLEEMVGIVEDGSTAALLQAGNCGMAVTCSVGSRATVSLSGMTGRKKLVSLQRSLTALDGTVIEPHEFYVSPSEETDWYPLLAACAVLLLTKGGLDGSELVW